jgi:hypothetical protein
MSPSGVEAPDLTSGTKWRISRIAGSSAATTRRRMNTAKVTRESPLAATMRLVLVKYLSVWPDAGSGAQREADEAIENRLMARNEGAR